ncbi:MAG: CorA family divalent cation transporter, partial [Gammaproteobacteria bacterium]
MTRSVLRKHAYHRPGTAPGTYDIAATRDTPHGHIELIEYDADHYTKSDGLASLASTQQLGSRWIQIDGPPSLDVLETVRRHYGIDPLVLEDIVNQGQRPKFNDYGNAVFITVSVPHPALMQPSLRHEASDDLKVPGHALYRQISIFVTDGLLITFMKQEAALFDPIEDRLRRAGGRLRTRDVYFLAHALIDLAIDTLFPLIDRTAEQLEALESAIMQHPDEAMLLAT